MSAAREHLEWLSLIEISGPFISLNVLDRIFPQGPDQISSEKLAGLRSVYNEWYANQFGLRPDPKIHEQWIDYVLKDLLEHHPADILRVPDIPQTLQVALPEHASALKPDIVLQDHSDPKAKPALLITVWSPEQDPEKPVLQKRYQAAPAEQMAELLHGTGVEAGLVTNGEKWMLVGAPKDEAVSYVTWYAELWCDERLTVRGFISLLGEHRCFSVSEENMLPAMLRESAADQQTMTDQLGNQVREAVEVLVGAIDRVDQDRGRTLLREIPETVLYESALTVMMRLVFLFSAEERGLLLLGTPVYDDNYAVSTLYDQLQTLADKQGEEVLERRYDAWCRLLGTFRAVFRGIDHADLKLPAYGGSLFDPDRFPFLEDRQPGQSMSEQTLPIEINNRTVLHLLRALQILQEHVAGTVLPRRLSFRALNVEQIGHVYEGLLDHTAKRASEVVLSLTGAKNINAEISLSELEKENAKGRASLLAWLKKQTGRTEKALEKALDRQPEELLLQRLSTVCAHQEPIINRVQPWAGLVRTDDTGYPCVYLPGSVYVTAGTERRATGTHYTPRTLTEPVVRYTLEPLVYTGPAEGLEKAQWELKSPSEILSLKVCDMAMGSAGFLVQVIRYLADRLCEAWELRAASNGTLLQITPEGKPAEGKPEERIIPKDPEERMILARRLVAERCIYGVDKNPLAVEIAKLSIWLTTMDKGKPFGFLDHALKCGDSLVGANEHNYRAWTHTALGSSEWSLIDNTLKENLEEARRLRNELETFPVIDIRDVEAKAQLAKQAEAALRKVREGCDVLIGAQLSGLKQEERERILSTLLLEHQANENLTSYNAQRLIREARKVNAFHWEFEFPEVFERGGFDAFVGNPPFIGGKHITSNFGIPYRDFLVEMIAKGTKGSADFCAYFLLQAFSLLRKKGNLGFITTNTIAQGDTREVGLDKIHNLGGTIFRANSSTVWPGQAAVFVSLVYLHKGVYSGFLSLDNNEVSSISSQLTNVENLESPFPLVCNNYKCSIGYYVLGNGFILPKDNAFEIIEQNNKYKEVLFPVINGKELNDNYIFSDDRYVINFFDWNFEKAQQYPICFDILKEKVFPERTRKKADGGFAVEKLAAINWWRFARPKIELREALKKLSRYLVCTCVTKYLSFSFYSDPNIVFTHATVLFLYETYAEFAVLQSNLYEGWARKYSSTMKNDLRFAPSDCFENFPFPRENTEERERTGEAFYTLRAQIMKDRQEGLTAVYNRFHNPEENAADIVEMRQRMTELNQAVLDAYGWDDLDLDQGFHETAQGLRFTISESARLEVLNRLLKLNHERHAEELAGAVSQPAAKPAAKKAARPRKPAETPKPQKDSEPVQSTFLPEVPPLPVPEQDSFELPSSDLASIDEPIGDWDACVCQSCGKHIRGFLRPGHTRDMHNNIDPGYRKISKRK